MICRSAAIPAIIGLGAAAVVAAGGATALAGAPSPTVTASGAAGSTPRIVVTAKDDTVKTDDSAVILTTAEVDKETATSLKVTEVRLRVEPNRGAPKVTDGCPVVAEACVLVDEKGTPKQVESVVKLGESITEDVTLSVTVIVETTVNEKPVTVRADPTTVKFDFDEPDPTPSTTPTSKPPSSGPPSSKPPKPSSKPTSKSPVTAAGSGGSGSGRGRSSGTGTTTGGVIPPAPNASFDPRNPQVALPPIATPGAPNPSVAPDTSMTPQSRLQGNKAPVAQDLTFERMASTQVAWLAALLVAFSLLLTQLRLGRRRMPAEAPKQPKGTHRRPRHGMFGK
ncbi:hypothetical protein BZB76_2456 [Actinomadura pelletieri DSM 43383]|uniref:Uncharacterized protein n=1 Tax=Actinomadura pelletieri DSM 43383 TaxID=1120940 RepID=A0A495QU81_9ACTN|nr:hypothetical protein [Actinomadura pelletieri]RKS77084.1 hypothetical protein BZB76_2456 [Actinomadura pelletieri DSM 43383]